MRSYHSPAIVGFLLLASCARSAGNDLPASSAADSSKVNPPQSQMAGTAVPASGGSAASQRTNGGAGARQQTGGVVATPATSTSASGTGGIAMPSAGSIAAAGQAGALPAAGSGGTSSPSGPSAGQGQGPTMTGSQPDAGAAEGGAATDLCDVGMSTGAAPLRPKLSGNIGTHDPTVFEADGTYYRFWTGDDVPSAKSSDLSVWTNASPVYRNGYPMWSRDWLAGISGQTFNFPWAPDVSYFGGVYHMYVSFSAKFGDNISCISHLTTSDVAGADWTDHGPVICTKGNENYNAIDPDVGFDAEGKPYLAFGSFWDGIMAFPLSAEGDRVGMELTRLAWAKEIEAPVLFKRCGYYYLFVSHGLCCPGQGRTVDQLTYRIAVGRSENILGPYVDRDGKKMLDGGGTVIVKGDSDFAAAGHSDVLVSRGHIYQIYHAYKRPRGEAELRIVELLFDADGWPVPSPP